ncbi:MAG: hypothetical protein R2845_01315 [Thermomicrobiales bacterium]
MSSIRGSIEHSSAVYPILGTLPLDRVWVGIEALSYDEVPIIGPVAGLDGLIVSAGFSSRFRAQPDHRPARERTDRRRRPEHLARCLRPQPLRRPPGRSGLPAPYGGING